MHIFRSFQRDWPWWRWRQHWARRCHTTTSGDRDSQTAMELPRARSSPQEQGRLEEAAVGDLPTMVVVEEEEGNHRTTTMAGGAEQAKSPSTPLTCLPERSPAAVEEEAVASLSIPSTCLEERNQEEGEMEATGRDPLMESRDPAEEAADPRMEGATAEGATGRDPAMEPAVGASFLASASLT